MADLSRTAKDQGLTFYEDVVKPARSKPLSKDPDFSHIIISALRYAMGRNTYITSLTADFIKRHWHRIPYFHQHNIHIELKDFLEDDTDTSAFNMIDHRNWQDLLAFIESQNTPKQQ